MFICIINIIPLKCLNILSLILASHKGIDLNKLGSKWFK